MNEHKMSLPKDEIQKIRTPFAKIIIEDYKGKQYYNILWFDPIDRQHHIGYGSYSLDLVRKWLLEFFEIVEEKRMTNGDRIRAMSDEELAYWFEWRSLCGHIQIEHEELCDVRGVCGGCVLNWLNQPAEVEE
jgi:hypothetical protein